MSDGHRPPLQGEHGGAEDAGAVAEGGLEEGGSLWSRSARVWSFDKLRMTEGEKERRS
jgi:hypothetical protein